MASENGWGGVSRLGETSSAEEKDSGLMVMVQWRWTLVVKAHLSWL